MVLGHTGCCFGEASSRFEDWKVYAGFLMVEFDSLYGFVNWL